MSSAGVGALLGYVLMFFISPLLILAVIFLVIYIYRQLLVIRKKYPEKELKVLLYSIIASVFISLLFSIASIALIFQIEDNFKGALKIPYISTLFLFAAMYAVWSYPVKDKISTKILSIKQAMNLSFFMQFPCYLLIVWFYT
jgi:hypothetical protein